MPKIKNFCKKLQRNYLLQLSAYLIMAAHRWWLRGIEVPWSKLLLYKKECLHILNPWLQYWWLTIFFSSSSWQLAGNDNYPDQKLGPLARYVLLHYILPYLQRKQRIPNNKKFNESLNHEYHMENMRLIRTFLSCHATHRSRLYMH